MTGSAPGVRRVATRLALAAVLVAAAAIRLAGIGWDDGTHLHPDERFLTMVTAAVGGGALKPSGPRAAATLAECRARHPGRNGVGPWLDTACSDFTPANVGFAFFPYGILPVAAVRVAAEAVQALGVAGAAGYDRIPTVGRVATTLADLVTLACAFLLGRALGGRRAGLAAAAFYALATLPVQLARFYTVDPFAAAFAALALVFAVRHVRRGERADAIAFGVAVGLAAACKLSLAPLLALLVPMAWLAPLPTGGAPFFRGRWVAMATVLVGGTAAALIVFRIAQPFVFAGPGLAGIALAPGVLDQWRELASTMQGSADLPPAWQWIGRTRWLDALRNLLVFGLGPALGLAVVASVALAAARVVAGPFARRRAVVVLLVAVVGYGGWLGAQWVSAMRYWLPLYPALAAFAGWGVVVVARRWRRRWPATRWAPAAFLAVAALTTLAYLAIPLAAPTRVWASAWLLERVPAGISAIVSEPGAALPRRVNFAFDGTLPRSPERARVRTVVPGDGSVDRLQLRLDGDDAALPQAVEIALTRDDGRVLLARADVALQRVAAPPAGFDAADRVAELVLPAPVALAAGERIDLEIAAHGARVAVAGATIATEGAWDDPVPMRHRRLPAGTRVEPGVPGYVHRATAPDGVDPFGQRYFRGVELPLVHPDEAAKRDAIARGLDRAQWLTISSQRFYDPVARDPYRFPLANHYYEALFAGRLGFDVVATFRSPPRIGGLAVDAQVHPWPDGYRATRARADASPEETFSVYDHPPVTVFRRSAAYDGARVRAILAEAPLRTLDEARRDGPPASVGRVVRTPAAAHVAPDLLMLAPERERRLEGAAPPGGAALGSIGAAIAFYVAATLLGAAALPWLAALLPSMPSVAWGLARTAGVFGFATIAWWSTWAGLDLWRPGALALVVVALVAAAALRARAQRHAIGALVRDEAGRGEVVFALLFAAGLAMRLANPDLWAPGYGGEKAMDLAILNAVVATDTFPPYDAWFAGGRLNYYYLGFVPVAALAKLCGAAPEVAYNVAIALWLALTGAAIFGVARALALRIDAIARRATLAGALSTVAGVAIGNLGIVAALADAPPRGDTLGARVLAGFAHPDPRWYWSPTRLVAERTRHGHEIHEFPYFTFLHGDLHAHLLALPLTIACWGIAAALVLDPTRRVAARLAAAVALAVTTALLRGANSWDWPLFSGVAVLALAIATWRGPAPLAHRRRWLAGAVAAFAVAQLVVAWPFAESFVTGGVAVRWYEGARTPLVPWLVQYGLFVWVLVPWLAVRPAPWPRPASAPAGFAALATAAAAFAWLFGEVARSAITGTSATALGAIAMLSALALRVVLDRRETPGERTLAALVAIGAAVQLVPEVVTVGLDIGRQNTYFKFHLQSWIALALAAGPAALILLARTRERAWRTGFAALAAVALAYVPVGFAARASARFDGERPATLDGLAFLASAQLDRDGRAWPLDGDRAIVAWLRTHAPRGAIVLEAQLPEYQYGSRIASFTGVRTLLGYRWHETQQRPVVPLGDVVNQRLATIDAIWRGADLARARQALAEYRVRYVVVGALERAVYPPAALERFEAWARAGEARVVFRHGDSTIYALDVPPVAGWPRL